MEEAETDEERRRRKKREASARCRANPEGREVARLASQKSNAKWLAVPENRTQVLFNNCRSSARRRGQACTLTLDDVQAMLRPMVCSVTGVPLSWDWDGPGANPWAPSIDRIDGSDGYHLENVRVVCWAFNQARGAWPDGVVRTWVMSLVAGAPGRGPSSPIDEA
jgi:hypothetical protein